jgi:hypothetical protein
MGFTTPSVGVPFGLQGPTPVPNDRTTGILTPFEAVPTRHTVPTFNSCAVGRRVNLPKSWNHFAASLTLAHPEYAQPKSAWAADERNRTAAVAC